jgi:hypothetical protein
LYGIRPRSSIKFCSSVCSAITIVFYYILKLSEALLATQPFTTPNFFSLHALV